MGNSRASRENYNKKRAERRKAEKLSVEQTIPNGKSFEITNLKKTIKELTNRLLTEDIVRSEIIGLASSSPVTPEWLTKSSQGTTSAVKTSGVPTLLASDWHWGETVSSDSIGGCNSFDLTIARARARNLINSSVSLLEDHVVSHQGFPGIVFALGGDMLSGDIHEELTKTNEIPLLPAFVDLYGVMIWCIDKLKERFGRVFLPCVTGNHSRTTKKMEGKNRVFTNFDWLLYTMLDKYYEHDNAVSFMIPTGPDAYFKIYEHRYLLRHGDMFRGGDGIIGAIGPIIRGDTKTRSRNNQIGMPYDTLLLCHFHQLIQMQRLIVNGSLVGYNEYAFNNGFGFEVPRQALWLTHPKYGITIQMPVNLQKTDESGSKPSSWVSWSDK